MNFVIDGLLVAVGVLCIVIGVRKGLFKSAADCLKLIAAAILASIAAHPISKWVFDAFVLEGFSERVRESVDGLEHVEGVQNYFETLPDFLKGFLQTRGITSSSLADTVSDSSEAVAQSIIDVLSPVFISIISFFAFIVLFIIFVILLSIVVRMISGIVALPILSQIDSLLGGVFGAVFAVIIMWIIVGAIQFIASLGGQETYVALKDAMDSSAIGGFISTLNPFSFIF